MASREQNQHLLPKLDDAIRGLGFDVWGVADASEPLTDDFNAYQAFVEAGYHGEMGYLAENARVRKRADDPGIVAGARSVICLGKLYRRELPDEAPNPELGTIAAYARGRDYHGGIRKQVRKLARYVDTLADNLHTRAFMDTAPLLERAWAQRAGLGFIGKNGLLIVPGLGSYLLLAQVVTTLPLPVSEPGKPRCGRCTLCLEGCPTDAFPMPYVLDARKCIAYTTIEYRGPVKGKLALAQGPYLFGCDTCQDVCPYNHGKPPPVETTRFFKAHERWRKLTLEDLLRLNAATFATLKQGSPLGRPGRAGLVRNGLVVAVGHKRVDLLGQIEALWKEDPSEVVRETARWALDELGAARQA